MPDSTNPFKYGMSKAELSGQSFQKDGNGKLAVNSIAQMNQDDVDSVELRISQEESVNIANFPSLSTRVGEEESVNTTNFPSLTTRVGQEESVNTTNFPSLSTRVGEEESVNTTNFPSLTTRVSEEESRESALFSSLDARLEREEKAVIIRDVPVTGGSNHIMVYGPLGPVGGTGNVDDDDIVIHGALRDKGDDNDNPIISLMLSGHNADHSYDPNTEGVAGHNACLLYTSPSPRD